MASWRPRKKVWSAVALVLLLEATDLAVRPFFYLLFMHSESLIDQERSVR
jgi:uncharacterized protein (DUF924 family)